MIVRNVGNDIIEIARLKKAWLRHGERFLDKLFTKKEQAYCLAKKACPERHLAGRFAAKEAIAKALGTGFGPISWLDIEILNDASGKPYVVVSDAVKQTFEDPTFLVSISHCHEYATAVALLLE
jgi:holo-[acyl-carrier protein] synthase